MLLKDLFKIQKATTTSREFFKNSIGIKCVHYGDIYKNYSFKFINSSKIINSFSKNVKEQMILNEDSIIIPDVTETISDYGHSTYVKFDGTPYINGTHALAITSTGGNLKYLFYYLQNSSNIKKIQSLLLGSTVFGISIKDFENLKLENFADYDTQQHIVDIIVHLIYSLSFYLNFHFLVAIFLIHLKLLLFFPLFLLASYRWNHQYQHIYPKLKNNHCL